MRVSFLVAGSAEEPYEVIFRNENGKVNVFCTCPAGENGLHCKHRLAIIEGSASAVVSANLDELEVVRTWLNGSDLEMACSEFRDAEKSFEEAKARFAKVKKKLGKVMNG
ncbi:SWIM zinc finger family protein [uncultured Thiodictyon sp.]|jgi:exonuclease VII small subunit|uniref:SWIM zinc finger family protein n=1 Tax=uncultured Thiodictyon sp. TaxID=1846217 RepID=UPI0025F96D89|nr:SWIM zinc finger family protein [uncultured Thiodictyon sp.]